MAEHSQERQNLLKGTAIVSDPKGGHNEIHVVIENILKSTCVTELPTLIHVHNAALAFAYL